MHAITEQMFRQRQKNVSAAALRRFDEMQKMGGPEVAAGYRKRLSSKMAEQGAILEKANKDKLEVKRLQGAFNQWQDEREKFANKIKELEKSLKAKDDLNKEERRKLQEEVEKANKKAAEMQEKLESMNRQMEKLENDNRNTRIALEELRYKLNGEKTDFKGLIMTVLEVASIMGGMVAGKYIFHSLLM